MTLRIKICGITRPADAEAAVEAGADAIGLVFWDGSPRRVTAREAARIAEDLPAWVARVGVFVNEPLPTLLATAAAARLTAIQLHGDEGRDHAAGIDRAWYRVFRAGAGTDPIEIAEAVARLGRTTFMLDTRSDTSPGGTGRPFDWSIAERVARRLRETDAARRYRMILAGGLSPDNVAGAVARLRECGLYGVDASSGVESAPGRKDPGRIRAFVDAVRCAG